MFQYYIENSPARPIYFGQVFCCGQNDAGQLGFSDEIDELIAPALLSNKINCIDIAAGSRHSLCLTDTGAIYTFGSNDYGALGRKTTGIDSESVPTKIKLPGPVHKLAVGDSHSAVLLDDGRVFAWGSFRSGDTCLSLTAKRDKYLPFEIVPNVKFLDVASGDGHLVLLSTNGKIYTVGCAEQGQLGRVGPRAATGKTRRKNTNCLTPGMVLVKNASVFDGIWASSNWYIVYCREMKFVISFFLLTDKSSSINMTYI